MISSGALQPLIQRIPLKENLTDPVRVGVESSHAFGCQSQLQMRTLSYRSVNSYWELRSDRPKKVQGRIAASALTSFRDTTKVAKGIQSKRKISMLFT